MSTSAVQVTAPAQGEAKAGWKPFRLRPQPFFDDKNRAFWILQSAGWAGYFFLRTLSGIANNFGLSLVIHITLLTATGCVEGGSLAISAGAPVTSAVRGRITNCGRAVSNASVLLLVQQDLQGQTRPVDTRIGPVTTTGDGGYAFHVSASFAVPGPASMQLEVTADGRTDEIEGGTLEFRLGTPARDTARFDVDLGNRRRAC